MLQSYFEQVAVTADLQETAFHVAQRMREFGVSSVVVMRGEGPVGVVTYKDLALRVVAEGYDPKTTCVSDIVTYDAASLSCDDSIETGAHVMGERGIIGLLIGTTEGPILGTVTADALTRLLAREIADVGAEIAEIAEALDAE